MDSGRAVGNGVDQDDHALISGFFGPGALAAWYQVLAAIAVRWVMVRTERFRITADFLAAMAYPVTTADYLLSRIAAFPTTVNGWGYMLKCLYGLHLNTYTGRKPAPASQSICAGVSGADMPEESTLCPHILVINAGVCVLAVFQAVVIVAIISELIMTDLTQHKLSIFRVLLYAGLVLALVPMLTLRIQESQPYDYNPVNAILLLDLFLSLSTILCCSAVMFMTPLMVGLTARQWKKGGRLRRQVAEFSKSPSEIPEAFCNYFTLPTLWLGCVACMHKMFPKVIFFPSSGISIAELDQAAAFAAGAVNLGYNIYTIMREI